MEGKADTVRSQCKAALWSPNLAIHRRCLPSRTAAVRWQLPSASLCRSPPSWRGGEVKAATAEAQHGPPLPVLLLCCFCGRRLLSHAAGVTLEDCNYGLFGQTFRAVREALRRISRDILIRRASSRIHQVPGRTVLQTDWPTRARSKWVSPVHPGL